MIAAGERLLLVEICDETLTCRRSWIDQENGAELDHPVPPETTDIALLVGGDRWLVTGTANRGPDQLVEVATGQTRPLPASAWHPVVSFTSDG